VIFLKQVSGLIIWSVMVLKAMYKNVLKILQEITIALVVNV